MEPDTFDYVLDREEETVIPITDFTIFFSEEEPIGLDDSAAFRLVEGPDIVFEELPFFFVDPDNLLAESDHGRRFSLGDGHTVSLDGDALVYDGVAIANFSRNMRLEELTLTDR